MLDQTIVNKLVNIIVEEDTFEQNIKMMNIQVAFVEGIEGFPLICSYIAFALASYKEDKVRPSKGRFLMYRDKVQTVLSR
jgi:hypothetical protein